MDFKKTLILLFALVFPLVSCGEVTTTVNSGVLATKISISGIGIVNNSLTLVVGDEVTLSAYVSPSDASNKDISWSSSNEATATVDSTGKIFAISSGSTQIQASTVEVSASINLIVISETVLTNIEFQESDVSVNIGSEKQLNIIYTPANATNVTLYYTVQPIGNAEAGLVSVSAAGLVSVSSSAISESQYLISAMVLSDTSISAVCTITVNEVQLTDISLKKNNEAVPIITSEENRLLIPVNLASGIFAFVPLFTPSNTTQTLVTYESSNEDIITINQYGIYSVSETAIVGDTVEITAYGSNSIEKMIYVEIAAPSNFVYQQLSKSYLDSLATDYRIEWDIEKYGTDGITNAIDDDYYDTAGNKDVTNALWRGGKTTSTYGGVAPWDGVWGVIFDSWDHPYNDDEVANQYMYNKIAIGTDMNILKLRVRSHITQTTSERGKFQVGVIPIDGEGNYLEPVYLELVQGLVSETDENWMIISNSSAADYEAGNDYFYFDISSFKGQTVIVFLEVDDMHEDGLLAGERDAELCDRIAWLGAWLKADTSEEE